MKHHTVGYIKHKIEEFANHLPHIKDWEASAFDTEFQNKLNRINDMSFLHPDHRGRLMKFCFEICAEELDKSILFHHTRYKPLGHPGDYLIIDWIYTRKANPQGDGKFWDEFYQRQTAAQAVRNRKNFFCDVFVQFCEEVQHGPSVLLLASGPCRDAADAIIRADPKAARTLFHCVDKDDRAIAYAKDVVQAQASNVLFKWEVANVFRIRPSHHYDLVWAGGLFDYLDDRYAATLLKRMWSWTGDGGQIIIANFHPRNPSRNTMEWCAEWFLHYRTEQEMRRLCQQAGIPQVHLVFDQEPLEVCIFCRIKSRPTSQ